VPYQLVAVLATTMLCASIILPMTPPRCSPPPSGTD
jgi:hypothetical protein